MERLLDADGSFLVAHQGGFLPQRAIEVAAQLRAYDRDLTLVTRCESRTRLVQRFEVWARDKAGGSYFVGAWAPHELVQIPTDIRMQDRSAPGHIPVNRRVEKVNSQVEADARSKLTDAVGEAYEHIASVKRQLEGGRTHFPMRGKLT